MGLRSRLAVVMVRHLVTLPIVAGLLFVCIGSASGVDPPPIAPKTGPAKPPANDQGEHQTAQQPGMPPRPDKEETFSIGNIDTVGNGPTNPTIWTIREWVLVSSIRTYHWNNAQGAAPGKISLKHEDGAVYGPWQAKGFDSADGIKKNITWRAWPKVPVKPGTYTVVDSDPPTWAQNAGSGQRGFVYIRFRRLGDVFLATTPLANGLVALWAGDGDSRDGAGNNDGQIKEGVTFAGGKFGQAFKLDGKGGYIDFGSPKALQITGSQSIAMWIRPDRLGVRQNPLAKACGGEGAITLEPDGAVSYDYGTSGHTQRSPYCRIGTCGSAHVKHAENQPTLYLKSTGGKAVIKAKEWTHIVVVRDVKSLKLRLYVNGKEIIEGEAAFPAAVATDLPLMIGKGYAENFADLIDDVGIWNRSLLAEEIRLLHVTPGLRHAMTASGTMAVAPAATRVAGIDRVLTKDGSVLLGALENPSFAMTAIFGKTEIAARQVAGIVPVEGAPGKVWLLLTDGQAIRGELADTVLRLKLAEGSMLRISLEKVRECGLRATDPKSASRTTVATATANPTMVVLRSGERLACADLNEDVTLETPYGRVVAPAKVLLRIEPSYDRLLCHRLILRNGSTLTGALLGEKLALKLKLGPTLTCPIGNVRGFVMLAGHVKPAGPATVQIRNGDRLFGKMADQMLTVRTEFGEVKIPAASLASMVFDLKKTGQVKAKTWSSATISGQLVEPAVTVVIGPDGPAVKVTAAQIASITSSSPLPPPEVLRKAEQLIAQLGAESYSDREAATKELLKMGKSIVPLLKKHLTSHDPELRQRIENILEQTAPKEAPPVAPPVARPVINGRLTL